MERNHYNCNSLVESIFLTAPPNGLNFRSAKPVSQTYFYGRLVLSLSPGFTVMTENRKSPPPPLLPGIALICSGNGHQMSEYERKLDRAKRLPFWPSIEFQSSCPFFVFCENQIVTNVRNEVGTDCLLLQKLPQQKRDGCSTLQGEGGIWSVTLLSASPLYWGGSGKWGRREEKNL